MKAMMISAEGPKKPKMGQQTVTSRVIKRNVKGQLDESGSDTSSTAMYADDNARKAAAQEGDSSFDGSAAPRVGGGAPMQKDGPVAGGSRKQMKAAKMRVNKSAASPAAKAAARRLYR